MATQYTLNVKNDSTLSGSFCVYQRDPKQSKYKNLYSLAWFTKACHPGTGVKFTWFLDYCFTWSETGVLNNGVFFEASEVVAADPNDVRKNSISLTREGGAYRFAEPSRSAEKGSLDIITDGTIPIATGKKGASIGIGMSGQSSFALQATPNMNFSFMPHPEYWITFGDLDEGQVIDINTVSQTEQIKFGYGEFSKSLSFGEDNLWYDLGNTAHVNSILLAEIAKQNSLH